MAAAGVPYAVGREPSATYDEPFAGIRFIDFLAEIRNSLGQAHLVDEIWKIDLPDANGNYIDGVTRVTRADKRELNNKQASVHAGSVRRNSAKRLGAGDSRRTSIRITITGLAGRTSAQPAGCCANTSCAIPSRAMRSLGRGRFTRPRRPLPALEIELSREGIEGL